MNSKATPASANHCGSPNTAPARASAAIISPFQSASTLSSRAGLGRCSRSAKERRPRIGERDFLLVRAGGGEAAQDGAALPVAAGRDVVGRLEQGGRFAERRVDLLFAPDVESAFLTVLVGVE